MFNIYTSLYNLDNGFIDWKKAIDNFVDFADEVVVATLPQDVKVLSDFLSPGWTSVPREKVKIVEVDISLDSIDFDGKLKNAALKACTKDFCILLDGDERINIKDKPQLENISKYLNDKNVDACFLPVIDLYNSEKEYKSLGQKWYLHKNKSHISRGVVNFACKTNGKIDTNKSDTCELIYDNGDLVYSYYLINPSLSNSEKLKAIKDFNYPVIYHLGWLDKEKRLKSNDFWQPVWNNRAGQEVKNIIHSKEKLDKIDYFPHGLRLWYE